MTTAVLVCPGRGTYNAPELGYLQRAGLDSRLLADFEAIRSEKGQTSIREMDGADRFDAAVHAVGENASALIYACTIADTLSLKDIEIVAVTGNSMGWYSALACAGALCWQDGFRLVNEMGTLMSAEAVGGQLVYPWMSPDWKMDFSRKTELLKLVADIDERNEHTLTLSIDLGGYLVLAGNAKGLTAFEKAVPPLDERFPVRLRHHAAYHSQLMQPISLKAMTSIALDGWQRPRFPLVDGRGHVWWPGTFEHETLRNYTLDHQVTQPYDFSSAIRTAALEFAPDMFIVPGPGTTLGGSVAQSLVSIGWMGMESKSDFQRQQLSREILKVMGQNKDRR